MFLCPCKRHFRIAYGMIVLAATQTYLTYLLTEMEFQLIHWKDRVHPGEKAFFFQTDSSNINLILTYQDMERFHNMVSKGLLVRRAQELLLGEEEGEE